MSMTDKEALKQWDDYRQSIMQSTPVDVNETYEQKQKRIAYLEANPQEWKKYYFPKYFKYESPDFHIRASKRILKNFKEKRHWYEVKHWVRGLAKGFMLAEIKAVVAARHFFPDILVGVEVVA